MITAALTTAAVCACILRAADLLADAVMELVWR
jgi:hypothetical protein